MLRAGTARRRIALQALLAAVVAVALVPAPVAEAVTARGNFAITVTPNGTYNAATYDLGGFRTGNGETVTGYTLTFPSDTNASGATSPGAGDVVTVAADNRTVTVVLGTPIAQRTSFDIAFGNVVNPSTAGTYSIPSVTFTRQGTTNQTINISGETYGIVAAPYLSMTITTPGSGQTVDFGTIDPGVATSARQVSVQVVSSANYTIARTVGGSWTELGLLVSGTATGAKTAGTAGYVDDYVLTPLWTTDPEIPLTATVVYTVTQ
ncbi:MAG: DUF2808 domain-containing protein [Coriobacteriia bacterium]|nr:DUF2808 domain-containing protein [Coriobacteriia bacterium]